MGYMTLSAVEIVLANQILEWCLKTELCNDHRQLFADMEEEEQWAVCKVVAERIYDGRSVNELLSKGLAEIKKERFW